MTPAAAYFNRVSTRVGRTWDKSRDGLRRFIRKARPDRDLNLRSMVSREPPAVTWFRRRVLGRKPVLYHFEVHIADHCNLNCKGCSHFSNIAKPRLADLHEFETDMKAMARLFSAIRQIVLLGGEALLHPQVADFVRTARRIFPRTRLYLMTNGLLVTRQNEEFWAALHETRTILYCNVYPIKLPVQEINRLARRHAVRIKWIDACEQFFKVPIDPEGGHDARSSFSRCHGRNNCPIVRNGRLYPCAYVAFADVFQESFKVRELEPGASDSIDIRNGHDPDKVLEFLLNPVPWCSHCDMDSLEFFRWGRSTRTIDEWIKTPLALPVLAWLMNPVLQVLQELATFSDAAARLV